MIKKANNKKANLKKINKLLKENLKDLIICKKCYENEEAEILYYKITGILKTLRSMKMITKSQEKKIDTFAYCLSAFSFKEYEECIIEYKKYIKDIEQKRKNWK